jgi:hypothetical protein
MRDLIGVLMFIVFMCAFALAVRRQNLFSLKPWEGPHDRETWLPDFITRHLD